MVKKKTGKGWDFTKKIIDFTALRNVTTSGSSFAITFPAELAEEAGIKPHDTVFVELKIKPLEQATPEDFKKLKREKQ